MSNDFKNYLQTLYKHKKNHPNGLGVLISSVFQIVIRSKNKAWVEPLVFLNTFEDNLNIRSTTI